MFKKSIHYKSLAFALGFTAMTTKGTEIQVFIQDLTAAAHLDPNGINVNTDADLISGVTQNPDAWTKYPSKALQTPGSPIDFSIALEYDDNRLHLGNGAKRNIALNRRLPVTDKNREAMPEGVAHLPPTLYVQETNPFGYKSDTETLRAPVVEWLQIKYRSLLKDKISDIQEIVKLVKEKGITYQNIWFADPTNEDNYELQFDDKGRPLAPNPHVLQNGVSGQGFYMALGQNLAVDILLTFEHKNKIYAVLNHRNEKGHPLSYPAGMVDPGDASKVEAVFRELCEEAGIKFDYERLEKDGRVQKIWTGTVGAERRQTQNAWTDSTMYHVHFTSIKDMSDYLLQISDTFDEKETYKRSIVDVAFVVKNYLMPGAPMNMFASHASMFKFALGTFFNQIENTSKADSLMAHSVGEVNANMTKEEAIELMDKDSLSFEYLHELVKSTKG